MVIFFFNLRAISEIVTIVNMQQYVNLPSPSWLAGNFTLRNNRLLLADLADFPLRAFSFVQFFSVFRRFRHFLHALFGAPMLPPGFAQAALAKSQMPTVAQNEQTVSHTPAPSAAWATTPNPSPKRHAVKPGGMPERAGHIASRHAWPSLLPH